MKIGLYGGSFDPIHHGHVMAVTDALEQAQLDRVIVLPAAQAPLRSGPPATAPEHRLAMVKLALEHEPRFEVSDWEIARPGVSYSIDTVEHFASVYPSANLFWILGEDQVARLPQWRSIESLAARVTFLVLSRPGFSETTVPVPGLRLQRCRGHLVELSSTEIRARARAHLSLESYVPHKAVAYLREKRLYSFDT